MQNLTPLKNFLEIPYDQLEEMNLEAKQKQLSRKSDKELEDFYLKYLGEEKRLKAVTVCFSDLEGRFHMLDYDKKFLLKSHDNLTFDGSSIRGFSVVSESDLRLAIDMLLAVRPGEARSGLFRLKAPPPVARPRRACPRAPSTKLAMCSRLTASCARCAARNRSITTMPSSPGK